MTTTLCDLSPLEGLDDSLLSGLRSALRRHGYDAPFVGRVEQIAPRQLDRVRLPVVHWWLRRQEEPAAALARLFGYADLVPTSTLEGVIPAKLLGALVEVGLLERSDGAIRSRVRLMPFEELWIASDEMDAADDPVMGPGATTVELARAMPVGAGASVLDVGCGAGSLALLAKARGAGEVVGVDLLERAILWSRFNARLNGLEVTFLSGDLLAPVEGRRFDIVVSQPPYVVKADEVEATTYLHGGRKGDEIALRLVRSLSEVLSDSGLGVLLFDVPAFEGQPAEGRLREILGAEPLQSYAIAAKGHSPDAQAIGYSAVLYPDLGQGYAAAAGRYREHLEALGIIESAHVLLVACRPPAGESGWVFIVETDEGLSGWNASALEEVRAGARLAAMADEALVGARVALDPSAWVVQEQSIDLRGANKVRLRFDQPHKPDFELSEAAARLIDVIVEVPDGSVRAVVKRFAKAARARPEEVRGAVLAFLRSGLISGFIVPRRS